MTTKNQKEFLELMQEISKNYAMINHLRYSLMPQLSALKTLYSNLAKASAMETHCPTFKSFLAENGKSYSQATFLMKIGEYLIEQQVEIKKLVENGIPISCIELLRKNKVKWNEDVYHNVLANQYPQLVKIYGKKKKENKKTKSK